jgi:tetratricopeptide (TPR) repeat protein
VSGPGCITVRTKNPLIKVFVDDCVSNLSLVIDSLILTSHIEIHRTSDFNLTLIKKVSTVQLDVSERVNVEYGDDLFSGDDDRLYFAGVSDLKVSYMGSELTADYKKDGASSVNEATEEEYQFVIWSDSGSLKKDSLMRVGNKFLTGSTIENSNLDKVSRLAIAKEKINEAVQHKADGNGSFEQGEYGQAVLFYTMAIDKVKGSSSPTQTPAKGPSLLAACLANRSACFLKLGHHVEALADGAECAEVEPGYIKGHFRMGLALHAMGRFKEALESLERARGLEPGNKQVKDAMKFAEVKLEMEIRKRMS